MIELILMMIVAVIGGFGIVIFTVLAYCAYYSAKPVIENKIKSLFSKRYKNDSN